jgi:hypothetical protein
LPNQEKYWLNTIIHYVPEHYDETADEFSLFRALPGADVQRKDIRTNSRARSRYRSYRDVYEICSKDGLDELAAAWLAFFVATQAVGFPGFGLKAAEIAEVCSLCAGIMANPAMSRAIRLALDLENERPENQGSRLCIGRLTALLDDGRKGSSAEVTPIVTSKPDAESFLRGNLGPNTWDALHDLTRGDLYQDSLIRTHTPNRAFRWR